MAAASPHGFSVAMKLSLFFAAYVFNKMFIFSATLELDIL